jgi:hypothetical protein
MLRRKSNQAYESRCGPVAPREAVETVQPPALEPENARPQ